MKDDPTRPAEALAAHSATSCAPTPRRSSAWSSPDATRTSPKGVAIGSILHTDEHCHIEPVRYGAGSGFFRLLALPHAPGADGGVARWRARVRGLAAAPAAAGRARSRCPTSPSTARSSSTCARSRGRCRFGSGAAPGPASRRGSHRARRPAAPPSAFIPEATELAERFAEKVRRRVGEHGDRDDARHPVDGAHPRRLLHRARAPATGVIDAQHRVFGYDGLYVIDGSAVSANPGVNPSLTITALAERAMSFVPQKQR